MREKSQGGHWPPCKGRLMLPLFIFRLANRFFYILPQKGVKIFGKL